MARQAEYLASLGPGSTFEHFEGADDAERRRLARAVLAMEQAERVAASLETLQLVRNFEQVTRWLKERIDRLATQESRAQHHLFEIEMAGRLARFLDLDVSFEEPDIVVRVGGRPVYLPCKRPRTIKAVADNIRDARRQLRGREGLSVILINTEAIFHRSGNPHRPVILYELQAAEEARAIGVDLVAEAIETGRRQADKAFLDGVTGILYSGVMVFWTRDPSAYQNLILSRRVSNGAVPAAESVVAELARLLFDRSDE